ncbi:MAG: hypothetical protein LBB53_04120 [Prevotellaceae bacterium]|jgi:hypothetical protein|nr:hypothetical protein [Prevotellaceae bacterium]
MTVLLFIAIFLIFSAGLIIFFNKNKDEKIIEISNECCGAHDICMHNSLLIKKDKVVCFDDEELNILTHKNPENFTENEIEMLQEIIFSLKKSDISDWLHSLELRKIALPEFLKEQVLFILNDA